jgi:hypothetical protein
MSGLHLWQILEAADCDEVLHVLPLVDLRAHVATAACSCHPTRQEHPHGVMFVHHSTTEPQQIH